MEMTKKMKMAAVGAAAVAVVGGGVFAYTRLAGGDPKETVKQTGKIVAKLESAKNLINTALCETIIIKNLKDVDLGNSHNQLNM